MTSQFAGNHSARGRRQLGPDWGDCSVTISQNLGPPDLAVMVHAMIPINGSANKAICHVGQKHHYVR